MAATSCARIYIVCSWVVPGPGYNAVALDNLVYARAQVAEMCWLCGQQLRSLHEGQNPVRIEMQAMDTAVHGIIQLHAQERKSRLQLGRTQHKAYVLLLPGTAAGVNRSREFAGVSGAQVQRGQPCGPLGTL